MTRRHVLVWLGAVGAWSLLLFSYRYLDVVLSGDDTPWIEPLLNELSGGVGAGLLFFPTRWLVARFPLRGSPRLRRLPLYLGAALGFAAVHTSLMWAQRELLYPLFGRGDYDYGEMPLRYAMELPMQLIGFVVMVAALHGAAAVRAARERELRAAQLESSLARAQLENLRLQLQPHFLFNALNTISATMYADPRAADEMIAALAELLRASLASAETGEVALREEVEILERYLALQRARFGERLRLSIDVAPELAEARVPSLLLQPLVENAVRHGNAGRTGEGTIALRARREEDRLILEVEDDGPGASPGEIAAGGLGLRATRERLRLLYGERQEFSAGRLERGGFRVRMSLPLAAGAAG